KFDEVPAEYDGDKTPVTLGMLHTRAKRRATEGIRTLYLPRFEPAGRFAHLNPDKGYLGDGIDDDGIYPKGGEPIPSGSLKPEDGLKALEYLLFCWSDKALEGLHVPQRELEEAKRRTEARRQHINLDGRVLHVWRGNHLAQDTDALADAII